jgi:NAD(P)-dependent dehydrogenase (short-subunit alcohol dehydrogenase family)
VQLNGKVAIVTGGSRGIGRAIVEALAGAGARVVFSYSSSAEAAEALAAATGATAVKADARDPAGVDALLSAAGDRVDVLVNNAGILRDKSFLKMDEEMLDAVIAVHLRGTFLVSQHFAKQLVAQGGGGRIVNTTSISGMLGNFGQANYSAAKAGIYGLTRTTAIELQKHRIAVNAIAPIAKTRMTEDLPMMHAVDNMTPEHIAPAALFLASELAGETTGTVLAVAGSRMYAYKVMESPGKFKDADEGVWTAQEIKEHWDAINKFPGA